MRLPIWSSDSTPHVDPWLLKKSFSHCEAEVLAGSYQWVNPSDKTEGCISTCRLRSREQASREHKMAAGTMRAAWGMVQSGYAGPLVFQMRREQGAVATA